MADNDIALGVQTPDSFKTIGGMLNFANQAQSLRTAQQEYERGGVKLEQERALLRPNIDKGTAESKTAQEGARQAEIKTNLDRFKLTGTYAQTARDIGQQLVSDPDVVNGNSAGIIPKIIAARQMMVESGVPADVAEVNASHLLTAAAANPKGFRQLLLNSIQAGLGSSGQAVNIKEGGAPVTNQQQSAVISTNPFGATPVGQPIAGTSQQQLLPPTTPVFDPATNAPGYLGPQRAEAPDEATALRMVQEAKGKPTTVSVAQKPIQSGPALGQQTTEEGKANVVKTHFTEAAANVASSSLLEGIAQNIKTFASRAIVGTEQERLAFVNGILEKVGVPGATDLKTATDLMEKNMAQLAKNSPAATDAARVVNSLASPHPTMNEHAIADAADQIIGQVRMSKSVYNHFLPHILKGDNAEYLKKLGEFSNIADARVWQFESLGPAEQQRMVADMKPEDRVSFREKIVKAKALGLFK